MVECEPPSLAAGADSRLAGNGDQQDETSRSPAGRVLFTCALTYAPVMLVIAALLVPVLLGRSLWYRDTFFFAYPLKLYLRQRLLAGEIPLWIPELGAGRPFLGMVQGGVFDPLNLFLLLLPPSMGPDVLTFTSLGIGALGTQRWLRSLGAEPADAVAGAMMLGFGGYMVSMAATAGPYLWGVAWVPWVLHHLARAAEERSLRSWMGRVAWTALALSACLHAGDPMAVWFAVIAGLGQGLGLAGSRARRGSLGALVGACALAALVSCAQLLAAWQVAFTVRPHGVDARLAGVLSTHPMRILELLFPGAFGQPYTDSWFVHELYRRGHKGPREPWAVGLYQGLGCVPLALAAVFSRTRRRLDIAMAVVTVLALILSLGVYTPVWGAFQAMAPGADMFRGPEKYWFLVSLGCAALGARGLALARAHLARMRAIAAAGVFVLLIVALLTMLYGAPLALGLTGNLGRVSPEDAALELSGAAWHGLGWALAWFTAALIFASRRTTMNRRALLLSALVTLDVLAAVPPLLPWASSTIHTDPSPLLRVMRDHAGGRLRGDRLLRPIDLAVWQIHEKPEALAATLPPNIGIAQGLFHVDSHDSSPRSEYLTLHRIVTRWPLRWMRLYGARFAILRPAAAQDLRMVSASPYGFYPLMEDTHPAAQVYLAARVVPATGLDDALRAIMDPAFTPGRDVAIEGVEPMGARGECHERAWAPEHVEIDCTAHSPGYMVLADSYYPGWTATVNGIKAPILPANVIFRAVRVPGGVSHISMRYAPLGWPGSLVPSFIGVAVCILLIVRGRKRVHWFGVLQSSGSPVALAKPDFARPS